MESRGPRVLFVAPLAFFEQKNHHINSSRFFSLYSNKQWRPPFTIHTVDGKNPAPPGMYETLKIMGTTTYQLVQDFFHQPYKFSPSQKSRAPETAKQISRSISWVRFFGPAFFFGGGRVFAEFKGPNF